MKQLVLISMFAVIFLIVGCIDAADNKIVADEFVGVWRTIQRLEARAADLFWFIMIGTMIYRENGLIFLPL